jgi:CubicO group peptidase (beta-lactamase class C family)
MTSAQYLASAGCARPARLARPGHMVALLVLWSLLVLAGCGSSTTTASPRPNSVTEKMDTILASEVTAHVFTGSVLVAQRGTVLLSKGYSMADWDRHAPNTATTRFRIGSLTKQFTATAILLLQERGKLQVHDPVCRYLSSCPTAWQPITIHHLLTHTSGIIDPTFDPNNLTQSYTPAQLVAVAQARPLASAPGTQFHYSSYGYFVLGAVIERVAGVDYATFLRDNIFTPLGLTNTGYDVNNPQSPQHAIGYSDWQVKAPFQDMSQMYAAGGVYSTVEDVYRWSQAPLTATLLSKASWDAMFTPYVPFCEGLSCGDGFDHLAYGYGWGIGADAHGTVVADIGLVAGFASILARYPESQVTLIVLSNMDTADVQGVFENLVHDVFAGV